MSIYLMLNAYGTLQVAPGNKELREKRVKLLDFANEQYF